MLPLQQAREVRDSVIEYIKATFRFKEKDVSDAFYRFIEDKQEGLFKGPYIAEDTFHLSDSRRKRRYSLGYCAQFRSLQTSVAGI